MNIIQVWNPHSERHSSIFLDKSGTLEIIGTLSHRETIRPKTKEDAQKLVDWLKAHFGVN